MSCQHRNRITAGRINNKPMVFCEDCRKWLIPRRPQRKRARFRDGLINEIVELQLQYADYPDEFPTVPFLEK